MRLADELPPDELTASRFESPFSPDWEPVFEPRHTSPSARRAGRNQTRSQREPDAPDNQYQALMEAKPFDEIPTSRLEKLALRDGIADAIDSLTERERWIFEANFYRGMSVRDIAAELALSKTHVHRLLDQALTKLRAQLARFVVE